MCVSCEADAQNLLKACVFYERYLVQGGCTTAFENTLNLQDGCANASKSHVFYKEDAQKHSTCASSVRQAQKQSYMWELYKKGVQKLKKTGLF